MAEPSTAVIGGAQTALSGWGRTAPSTATVVRPRSVADVAELVRTAPSRGIVARGLGRSYGDAAGNAGGLVADLRGLAEIGTPDPVTGELTCGAGADLDTILRATVPAGWFVPVTPGTRQVTLGGAVAADVHGKNHHRDGSIGAHLTRIELVEGHGELRTLTPDDPLFWATVGGMGLTGVITSVTLRMRAIESAQIAVDTQRTADLSATMAALLDRDHDRQYSVAWLDCLARGSHLGRGVVTSGDHLPASIAGPDPLHYAPPAARRVPVRPPIAVIGRAAMTAFNEAYYRRAPRRGSAVPTPLATFFHPLDAVADWNVLYGPRGFVQYQFVSADPDVVEGVLVLLQRARVPGLLAVLKRFGPGNAAPLSFPMQGWTLAVDMPARAEGLRAALDVADDLVQSSGGRCYLAKDARCAAHRLAAMYPRLGEWRSLRASADPRGVFTSDLGRRLQL